ncbi:MAG: glycosyltransferase family 4 protein [Acidobacteria bacterium]|nr:glycosyltransferase family 4 protein [Acidobacteriota bacterium]
MKRVLVAIQTPVFGGPHNQLNRLAEPLRARGWETVGLLPSEPGNGSARLENNGIPVLKTPMHRMRARWEPRFHFEFLYRFRQEVESIRRILRDQRADVVQICGLMNLQSAFAARLERIPLVWQLLGTFAPRPLRWTLMPLVVRMADSLMTVGPQVTRAHPGAGRFGNRLFEFLPPVDCSRFRPDDRERLQARKKLQVPAGGVLIGTLGNRNRIKGHEFLVDAAQILRQGFPNLYFRVLGSFTSANAGFYAKRVHRRVMDLGLHADRRFAFYDPGSRVENFLPGFDLFVLPSRQEGTPTSLMEAMASGLPVVATDVGNVRKMIEEGVTGFVVPPRCPEALARRLADLLREPGRAMEMGAAARRHAVKNFDVEKCADLHVQAYRKAQEVRLGNPSDRGSLPVSLRANR